ncbi:MAG: prolipoprotein diacylglyceryl transferase [Chitinivibrionales bacterium]|nr:prolipoprotein diacylglyceryl transferase [Chitinivibrionales bacterium]MBD3396497.1 prolipoprotein diacylglyceryl transferase [Chitinivibrionales bacterium]
MHPILFQIGKLPIHSYGFMLALSFLLGIWFGGWRAKRRGLDGDVLSDVGFWIILAAIVGARLYYVVLHFEEFSDNILGVINPFHGGSMGIGGLVMYGGYIGAILAGVAYFRIKKIPFLPYADAAAPTIGFGIFLTRIGCFLNGCCFGAPTEASWGVDFPSSCPAGHYQLGVHADALHPSQLYLSAGGLIIALIILALGRKKVFAGFEFFLFGILYSILRFAVDFTRYYTPDEHLLGLTHNQIVCIGIFVVFGGLMLKSVLGEAPAPQEPVPEVLVEPEPHQPPPPAESTPEEGPGEEG